MEFGNSSILEYGIYTYIIGLVMLSPKPRFPFLNSSLLATEEPLTPETPIVRYYLQALSLEIKDSSLHTPFSLNSFTKPIADEAATPPTITI